MVELKLPIDAVLQLQDYQRQLDPDGTFVGVSRQALDEVLAYVTRPPTGEALRIAELEAEDAALKAVRDDDGEMLTIAWMDGSHRSTKAHRATLATLQARGDRLAGYAGHRDDCEAVQTPWSDPGACTCGFTEALTEWRKP